MFFNPVFHSYSPEWGCQQVFPAKYSIYCRDHWQAAKHNVNLFRVMSFLPNFHFSQHLFWQRKVQGYVTPVIKFCFVEIYFQPIRMLIWYGCKYWSIRKGERMRAAEVCNPFAVCECYYFSHKTKLAVHWLAQGLHCRLIRAITTFTSFAHFLFLDYVLP